MGEPMGLSNAGSMLSGSSTVVPRGKRCSLGSLLSAGDHFDRFIPLSFNNTRLFR